MSRLLKLSGLVVALFFLAVASLQLQVSLGGRRIDGLKPGDLQIFLPLQDGGALERVLVRLAGRARVAMAIERVVDEPLQPGVRQVPRNPRTVDLAGKALGDALTLVFEKPPSLRTSRSDSAYHFTWQERNGVIGVSPVAGRESFLDRVVSRFEVDNVTPLDAVARLHQVLAPDYIAASQPSFQSHMPEAGDDERKPKSDRYGKTSDFGRRVSLTLEGRTLREILDALIVRHGEMSWVVRYPDLSLEYRRSSIALVTFAGDTVLMPASSK